jgi:hypothetical protein
MMDRHSWTLWRCMTQNVMYGKRVSPSQVDAQDMHLQYRIISVWFTVNNMIIQWQWIHLHQGEGIDKAMKECRHDEGENLPTINAIQTVNEDVWGDAQKFHSWWKHCLIWRLCVWFYCVSRLCTWLLPWWVLQIWRSAFLAPLQWKSFLYSSYCNHLNVCCIYCFEFP